MLWLKIQNDKFNQDPANERTDFRQRMMYSKYMGTFYLWWCLVFLDLSTRPVVSCPDGMTNFGGKCYELVDDFPLKYSEVLLECSKKYDGIPAVVDGPEISNFITSIVQSSSRSVFIGLTDSVLEDTYVWADGTPLDWSAWSPLDNQPDKGNTENCVKLDHFDSWRWHNDKCGEEFGFICQYTNIDGGWSEWTNFSSCTTTCGNGWQSRSRSCDNPKPMNAGNICAGAHSHTAWCLEKHCIVNGGWSDWGDWGACSNTCGDGVRMRDRNCTNPTPEFGGLECTGNSTEMTNCSSQNCTVDGGWSEWGNWSSCVFFFCSSTPYQYRSRVCNNPDPEFGGKNCVGESMQQETCSLCIGSMDEWSAWSACTTTCDHGVSTRQRNCSDNYNIFNCNYMNNQIESKSCLQSNCSVNGGWSDWGDWGACSNTCGDGVRMRDRNCTNPTPEFGGLECTGNSTEMTNCSSQNCTVDGGWSEWGNWSSCVYMCSSAPYQYRSRVCNNPDPEFGGKNCVGESMQQETCSFCIGSMDEWSAWSACTTTCDHGVSTRQRNCSDNYNIFNCNYINNQIESKSCLQSNCSVNGGWSDWGDWGACSNTCGDGVRMRDRNCTNPTPEFGGLECTGNSTEMTNCSSQNCTVDGGWSEWGNWSSCVYMCSSAPYQYRSRVCNNPDPEFGGKNCVGESMQQETCSFCIGSMGEWSAWSACTTTCGHGVSTRQRNCSDNYYLFTCNYINNQIESKSCLQSNCSVDGAWSDWSNWSACSVSCGNGVRMRGRNCSDPSPEFGGLHCTGNSTEKSNCSLQNCPVDGAWNDWSNWSACSVTCGNGVRMRGRNCTDPSPEFRGLHCTGNSTEKSNCSLQNCTVDGAWSDWSNWGACSVTCGNGVRMRERNCSDPSPEFGGLHCTGNSTEKSNCSLQSCQGEGLWSDWGPWSQCSASCGVGRSTRARCCLTGATTVPGHNVTCPGSCCDMKTCSAKANCPDYVADISQYLISATSRKPTTTWGETRPSAQSIGVVATALLVSIFAGLIILDFRTLFQHLRGKND